MDEERTTAGQAMRRFTLGSGPLKRTSDRLEFLARVLLVCSLAMAIPIALTVASVAHARTVTEATAQSLDRHQVDAELVADGSLAGRGSDDVPPVFRAPVVWRGPSGEERTGDVVVRAGAEAGSTVPIWVDQSGDRTTRPLDGGDAVVTAISMGAGTCLLISALAFGAYVGFRASLNRSRLRRWEADWAVVEPVWSRKVP